MDDKALIKRIKRIIGRHLEDQASPSPMSELKDVPAEIHGELADLIYIDKVANWLLVSLLIGLFTCREDRTDKEILQLLKDVNESLNMLNMDFKV